MNILKKRVPLMNTNFKFTVLQTFQSAMVRQLTEVVKIRSIVESVVLNSLLPAASNRCSLPRLFVAFNNNVLDGEGGPFASRRLNGKGRSGNTHTRYKKETAS